MVLSGQATNSIWASRLIWPDTKICFGKTNLGVAQAGLIEISLPPDRVIGLWPGWNCWLAQIVFGLPGCHHCPSSWGPADPPAPPAGTPMGCCLEILDKYRTRGTVRA